MRIRIVKASLPTYWYANHIGEERDVDRTTKDGYIVDSDAYGSFFVGKEDAEVIEGDAT